MTSLLAKVDTETAQKALALAAATIKARKALGASTWHPEAYQVAPGGDWTIWAFVGGRGAGKTMAGAGALDAHAKSPACLSGKVPHRMAIVAATDTDAVKTCVRGETGVLRVNPSVSFAPGSRLHAPLTWSNGAEAELFGCFNPEDVERFRGPQYCFVWGDEVAAWRKLDDAWPMIELGLRLGPHPRAVLTTTPKMRAKFRAILKQVGTVLTKASTADNPHLPEHRREAFYKAYGGTLLGRQELDAELLDDVDGALWSRTKIEEYRRAGAPELIRIVVALDPSATSSDDSDECGIIMAGIDAQGEGYVLEDGSFRGTPLQWATKAVELYEKRGADRIVAETNNGGEMVETVIRSVPGGKNVSYKTVTASRGKAIRAEPVSALSARGLIHFVGTFPELEDQLCTWLQGDKKSPDRLDAFVWAFTELMLDDDHSVLSYYQQQLAKQQQGATA